MQSSIFNFFSSSSTKPKARKSLKRKSKNTNEVIVISSDEDQDNCQISKKLFLESDIESRCKIPTDFQVATEIAKLPNKESSFVTNKENSENVAPTDKVVHKNEASAMSDQDPYYLKNFKVALDSVMNDEIDSTLFEGEDATWVKKFTNLPSASQKLYVRLFHRKLAWLPLNKIVYKEIGDDLSHPLKILVEEKFVDCSISNGKSNLSLHEVLGLLQVSALKTIAKSFHLPIIGSKQQITTSIMDIYKNQRSVFSSSSTCLKDTILKRALSALGFCYKVLLEPKKAFNRIFLVFDVTKGTEDDSEFSLNGSNQNPYYNKNRQLFTILMAEMGQIIYPSYTIKKSVAIFGNRLELLEYEAAYRLLSEIIAASDDSQWKRALELCESAEKQSRSVTESSRHRTMNLPRFIQGFSASAVYIRIKSLQVEILQRLRDYKRASEILQSLLQENHFCLSRRGFWAERLALNFDQHLHDQVSALQVIKSALNDKHVRVGHLVALVERARKIASSGKAKDEELEIMLQIYDFQKAKEFTIVGRLLPKRMQTGQARFMKVGATDDDVLLCSVEELALDHYKCQGYDEGLHGEGGTFTCFFCLLLWDILFMPGIDDVFRTKYQTNPLDYNTDDFYSNRKKAIDVRVEQIKSWKTDDFDACAMIIEHWNLYNDVACTGMNWDRFKSAQQAVDVAKCIGGPVLGGIIEIFAGDPRHTRSGLPDLVVWNSTSNIYKFVEVKGPGDRLSNNQKMWMHRLVTLGADVEVCHVTANASRRIHT